MMRGLLSEWGYAVVLVAGDSLELYEQARDLASSRERFVARLGEAASLNAPPPEFNDEGWP